jgi:hypothetical protein
MEFTDLLVATLLGSAVVGVFVVAAAVIHAGLTRREQ